MSETHRPVSNAATPRYKPYPKYKDSGIEWLGRIPAHWEIRRLKTVSTVQLSNADKLTIEGEKPVRLCNYLDVYKNEAITQDMNFMEATATPSQIRRLSLRKGDLLITKDSESWTDIAVASVVKDDLSDVICGYHLALIRPGAVCLGEFLARSFNAIGPRHQFQIAANGITRFALGGGSIRDSLFLIPPFSEQAGVANFLDRETSKIDALVARNEQLVELLQERRTTLITVAATRGLDPNVPLQGAESAWVGEIPKHWQIEAFTKHVIEKSDYRGKTPEKVASGIFLVTARNVKMGMIDYAGSQEYISEAEYHEVMKRGYPRYGDIVFTTEAPLGNVALVDNEQVAFAQRIIRFRMNPSHLDNGFTLYAMMTGFFAAQLSSLSTGSTAEGLKASKLNMLRIAVPPDLAEQQAIVAYLNLETVRIDALIAKVREAIDRLKELRDALISAAVTGKIDVREEVE